MFFIALGVSFSIQADLGVSPVSSLAYAFSLTTGLSIGLMTLVANTLFISLQVVLRKQFTWRGSISQLVIAFLFGFYMDVTLYFILMFPAPETLIMRWIFLVISLFVISIGLLAYISSQFLLLPYDELTQAITKRFNIPFSKAKTSSDIINVSVAGLICIIFIQSLGSIGIGTIIAAYFIGKILGWLSNRYQKKLVEWINFQKIEIHKESKANKTMPLR